MRYLITKEIRIDRNNINKQLINLAEILSIHETEYECFIIFNTTENIARIGILSEDGYVIKRLYRGSKKRASIIFRYTNELFCGPFSDPTTSSFRSQVKDNKFLGWVVEITNFTVKSILYNYDIPGSLEQLKTICGISKQGI